jgi:uncharacterized protein YbaR (Trm112 family)
VHLVLTDILGCPRCGPDQGLIVLSERMEHRRILDGRLGCPNCHTDYPIRDGLVDLRAGGAARAAPPGSAHTADAGRLAALAGITRGFGLLLGVTAELAGSIAAVVPDVEWVVVGPGLEHANERACVNRLLVAGPLPIRSRSTNAAVVLDPHFDIADVIRVLAIGGRLVLATGSASPEMLGRNDLRILARDETTVVAERAP